MDTGMADGALALAQGAYLLICEATFLETEAGLAIFTRPAPSTLT
jgi:ribonuclease BN (tRNA processing enzyme)